VSHRRGSVRSQTQVTQRRQHRQANPNVMSRSGGNHPSRCQRHADDRAGEQATRNRRVNPRTCSVPTAASGKVTHGAYRRTFSGTGTGGLVQRVGETGSARNPSFDVSTDSCGGPITMDSRPAATTTPPPPSAASTRPASERHPCRFEDPGHGGRHDQDQRAHEEELGMESPPPPSSRAAPIRASSAATRRPLAAAMNGSA
jgi:hypothetical protein